MLQGREAVIDWFLGVGRFRAAVGAALAALEAGRATTRGLLTRSAGPAWSEPRRHGGADAETATVPAHGDALGHASMTTVRCDKRAVPAWGAAGGEYVVACPHGTTAGYVLGAEVPDALVWSMVAARHEATAGCGCARLVGRLHRRAGLN